MGKLSTLGFVPAILKGVGRFNTLEISGDRRGVAPLSRGNFCQSTSVPALGRRLFARVEAARRAVIVYDVSIIGIVERVFSEGGEYSRKFFDYN
ncbi:MAG: hypothetical protein KKF56_03780 [Nanoarchaeota archaeon]|nr:hypothetical protein [Nanoarchaeota archaeon]